MHILIGMAVATVLIIGWAYGNLFCAVFLTLAPAAGAFILLLQKTGPSPWALPCIGLVAVIWAPRYFIQRQQRIRWEKAEANRALSYTWTITPAEAAAEAKAKTELALIGHVLRKG